MSEINIRKRYYEYSKLRRRNGKGIVPGVLLVLAVTAVLIVAAFAPKEKTFCGLLVIFQRTTFRLFRRRNKKVIKNGKKSLFEVRRRKNHC